MDGEEQVRLVATETIGAPVSLEIVRDRRLQGGLYSLYELVVDNHRFYAVDILNNDSHAAMMVDDEQIEQIFGFEALPDRGDTTPRPVLPE